MEKLRRWLKLAAFDKKKIFLIYGIFMLLFLIIVIYLDIYGSRDRQKRFYSDSIQFVVIRKYIDTEEHMSHILEIRDVHSGVVKNFMPSSLILSTLVYDSSTVGDTLSKRTNSFDVVITKGKRKIIIESNPPFQ